MTPSSARERPGAMHRAREGPQGIPGSLEVDLGSRQLWPITQDPIWRAGTTCSPGRCAGPGRDLRVSRGPLKRTLGDENPGPRRRTPSDWWPPLAGQHPSEGAAFTLEAVRLFPGPTGKAISRIDGQCAKGSDLVDPNLDPTNLDPTEYNYLHHTERRVSRSQRPELV
jgi:hypothetical protein